MYGLLSCVIKCFFLAMLLDRRLQERKLSMFDPAVTQPIYANINWGFGGMYLSPPVVRKRLAKGPRAPPCGPRIKQISFQDTHHHKDKAAMDLNDNDEVEDNKGLVSFLNDHLQQRMKINQTDDSDDKKLVSLIHDSHLMQMNHDEIDQSQIYTFMNEHNLRSAPTVPQHAGKPPKSKSEDPNYSNLATEFPPEIRLQNATPGNSVKNGMKLPTRRQSVIPRSHMKPVHVPQTYDIVEDSLRHSRYRQYPDSIPNECTNYCCDGCDCYDCCTGCSNYCCEPCPVPACCQAAANCCCCPDQSQSCCSDQRCCGDQLQAMTPHAGQSQQCCSCNQLQTMNHSGQPQQRCSCGVQLQAMGQSRAVARSQSDRLNRNQSRSVERGLPRSERERVMGDHFQANNDACHRNNDVRYVKSPKRLRQRRHSCAHADPHAIYSMPQI